MAKKIYETQADMKNVLARVIDPRARDESEPPLLSQPEFPDKETQLLSERKISRMPMHVSLLASQDAVPLHEYFTQGYWDGPITHRPMPWPIPEWVPLQALFNHFGSVDHSERFFRPSSKGFISLGKMALITDAIPKGVNLGATLQPIMSIPHFNTYAGESEYLEEYKAMAWRYYWETWQFYRHWMLWRPYQKIFGMSRRSSTIERLINTENSVGSQRHYIVPPSEQVQPRIVMQRNMTLSIKDTGRPVGGLFIHKNLYWRYQHYITHGSLDYPLHSDGILTGDNSFYILQADYAWAERILRRAWEIATMHYHQKQPLTILHVRDFMTSINPNLSTIAA